MRTLVLTVSGMSCDGCVEHLTRSLESVEGVRNVQVDLMSRTARVEHDDTVCQPSDLVAAVRRVGYQVDAFNHAEAAAS